MPYVITTTTPARDRAPRIGPWTTRTAVATLDEARDLIATRYDHRTAVLATARDTDLIGPLPDGTVIEVRPVGGVELADMAGVLRDEPMAVKIAAFNRSNA